MPAWSRHAIDSVSVSSPLHAVAPDVAASARAIAAKMRRARPPSIVDDDLHPRCRTLAIGPQPAIGRIPTSQEVVIADDETILSLDEDEAADVVEVFGKHFR